MGIYPIGSLVQLTSNYLAVIIESRIENPLQPVVRIVYDIKNGLFPAPRDIDLSNENDYINQIKCAASPQKWNIDPMKYLDLRDFSNLSG